MGQSKLLTNSLADQYAKTGSFPVFIFQSNLKITSGILKAAPLLSSQPSPVNWVSAFFPIPDAPTLDQALIPSCSGFCQAPSGAMDAQGSAWPEELSLREDPLQSPSSTYGWKWDL